MSFGLSQEQPPFSVDEDLRDFLIRRFVDIDTAFKQASKFPERKEMPYKPQTGDVHYFGNPANHNYDAAILNEGFWGLVNGTWIDLGQSSVAVAVDTTRNITIENPTAADNFALFFTDVAITVAQINFVIQGSTSVTAFVRFGPDRSAAGTNVINAGTIVSNTTTGQEITSFDNAIIPADSWIWIATTAIVLIPLTLAISVRYNA